MKLSVVATFAIVAAIVSGRTLTTVSNNFKFPKSFPAAIEAPRKSLRPRERFWDPRQEPSSTEEWEFYQCRGSKLLQAMSTDNKGAGALMTPPQISAQSIWNGKLNEELLLWGYTEKVPKADVCDFGEDGKDLGKAFEALGIDTTSSAQGGPNICFEHRHGDETKKDNDGKLMPLENQRYMVNNREYRVTGAYSEVGFNFDKGVIFMLNRKSPKQAAKQLWKVNEPSNNDLPALKLSSDIMWGMWNRGSQDKTKVNLFMNVWVVNTISERLIRRALDSDAKNPGELQKWPGNTFDIASQEGQALLGSPNGLAVGLFLIQHKEQLGNKLISKVQVWQTEGGEYEEPNMIFYVDTGENHGKSPHGAVHNRNDSGQWSEDGKTLVRRHMLRSGP